MLRIQIAGVTILGAPYAGLSNVDGLFVGPDGFQGWEDGGGDSRREAIDRPSQHGQFDLPVFQGSRVVTIDGMALATTASKLRTLRNRVMGVCADGRARLTVEHQEQTLWADVRRGVTPTFRDAGIRHGLHRGRFMLSFVAADPRRYGESAEFAAGEAAVQYGNFPATPRLLIGAGSGGYTVTGPGGRQVVVGTAPAGAHYIDFATGGLFTSAGVRQLGAITTYQPWTVGPGVPGVTASITGSRTLVQRVADTFV